MSIYEQRWGQKEPFCKGLNLIESITDIQQRIAQACADCGRAASSVKLLAVSKQQSAASISAASEQGLTMMGENYLSEAIAKQQELRDKSLEWHFIGALQANKSKIAAENFAWVHSVDRIKLAHRLSKQRPPQRAKLNILLQVKVNLDANKSGCAPESLPELIEQILPLANLRLRGLMNIPALDTDPKANFTTMRELFEQCADQLPAEHKSDWDTLSMGMSADFVEAIHAGSTMVRIGSALFGARSKEGL